ncbi:MAG: hypothetical protein U9Q83_06640 [Bacteroidota bacterium]|nr:hypothetical protein [Bacteroidota bacterium]
MLLLLLGPDYHHLLQIPHEMFLHDEIMLLIFQLCEHLEIYERIDLLDEL